MNPSIPVVLAVALIVSIAVGFTHLLRYLSRRQRSSPSSYPASVSPPLSAARQLLASTTSSSSSSSSPSSTVAAADLPLPLRAPGRGMDGEEEDPYDLLPVFTLASSLTTLSKSYQDCAVCICPFQPDDPLRLLPSCGHAFHSACIDVWLRCNFSCPLCRSPILKEKEPLAPPPPPPPPPPPLPVPSAPPLEVSTVPAARGTTTPSDWSGSYRIEIGSISRQLSLEADGPALRPNARTYSLSSSFEYVFEGDVEAVVSALSEHIRRQRQSKDTSDRGPTPPGDGVAESVGGGTGGSRNWLRDYLDRLVPSASSSFSSIRFSRRSSSRFDAASPAASTAAGGGRSWDLDSRWPREDDEFTGIYNAFHRWLVGA